jgi:hypothetical protein
MGYLPLEDTELLAEQQQVKVLLMVSHPRRGDAIKQA